MTGVARKVGSGPLRRKDIYDIGVWSRRLDDQRYTARPGRAARHRRLLAPASICASECCTSRKNPLLREPLTPVAMTDWARKLRTVIVAHLEGQYAVGAAILAQMSFCFIVSTSV